MAKGGFRLRSGLSLVVVWHSFRRVILFVDGFKVVNGYARIHLGRFQGFMAEHFLDMAHWRPVSKHVGSTGVPERMVRSEFVHA